MTRASHLAIEPTSGTIQTTRTNRHAISVWNEGRTLQVGHIPSWIASSLGPAARVGITLYEQREAGRRTQLGILVSREPVTLAPIALSEERRAWLVKTVNRLKATAREAQTKRDSEKMIRPPGDPMDQMRCMSEELDRLKEE